MSKQMADAFMAIFDFKPVEETMCNFDSDYFEEGSTSMTCASCRFSRWHQSTNGTGLWCETHSRQAKDACGDFSYEMGSDEAERG